MILKQCDIIGGRMIEWKTLEEHGKPEAGAYLVYNEKYYTDPLTVYFSDGEFVVGPHSHHLPSNLPISVTHYCSIPPIKSYLF